MTKTRFFYCINLFSLMMYASHSAATIFFPILAKTRNLNTILIGLFFSAFPVGSFPASLYIGKLMRFYRKDRLLLFFNICLCLARFFVGTLYYNEDVQLFFIIAFISRFLTGVAEGCVTPVLYSYIPELFPADMMVKFGILEIWGSSGVIIGGVATSYIYEEWGYFAVFWVTSLFNVFFGSLVILFGLRSERIEIFSHKEKKSLPMRTALFENQAVMWNFFYLFFIFFPNYMILPGYELYIKTLSNDVYIASIIYGFIFLGMIVGVFVISWAYEDHKQSRFLFFSGGVLIVALLFFGPDPVFGITDVPVQLTLIAVAFLATGIVMEVVFLIITKKLINDLYEVFPEDKNLCADFANGLFTACFGMDQLVAPIFGSMLNIYLGYENSGACFSLLILMVFFIGYWVTQSLMKTRKYEEMSEERQKEQAEI